MLNLSGTLAFPGELLECFIIPVRRQKLHLQVIIGGLLLLSIHLGTRLLGLCSRPRSCGHHFSFASSGTHLEMRFLDVSRLIEHSELHSGCEFILPLAACIHGKQVQE